MLCKLRVWALHLVMAMTYLYIFGGMDGGYTAATASAIKCIELKSWLW
jgi:hypothetical protein